MGKYQVAIVSKKGEISGSTFDDVLDALSYFSNVHHLIETSEIADVEEYYFKARSYIMVNHFAKCAIYFPDKEYLIFYDCTFEEVPYKARLEREATDEPFYIYDLVNNNCKKYEESE